MPTKRTYADHGDACAAAHAMELVGDRWNYPVLRELMLAPKRFGELEASVRGITPAVLSARLRELEASGLVRKVTLPAPARVTAYELTEWARELRPLLEGLARWALASPIRRVDGCGLTPDATIQSMLTMAPAVSQQPPIALELHLHDARVPGDEGYAYRLTWSDQLSIERGTAPDAPASVTGDSSTWIAVLYEGVDLGEMQVLGDIGAVERLMAAYRPLLHH